MERGGHRSKGMNGRFRGLEEAVESVKLEIAVACCERTPRERARDVRRDGGVESSHGGEFTGEHRFTLGSSGDLRRSVSQIESSA